MPYTAKLTADKILETALELLEKGGPDALGMRPLAAALGVRPSSLYRYYPELEALLERSRLEPAATYMTRSAVLLATGRPPTPSRRRRTPI